MREAWAVRTVTDVELGLIGTAGAPVPALPWSRAARTATTAAHTIGDSTADGSRLPAVVELIKTLTGREVKLVPPAAYLISPPTSRTPEPVDLVVAAELPDANHTDGEPLVVDVTPVLRHGTSGRMILDTNGQGQLMLFGGVDLTL